MKIFDVIQGVAVEYFGKACDYKWARVATLLCDQLATLLSTPTFLVHSN